MEVIGATSEVLLALSYSIQFLWAIRGRFRDATTEAAFDAITGCEDLLLEIVELVKLQTIPLEPSTVVYLGRSIEGITEEINNIRSILPQIESRALAKFMRATTEDEALSNRLQQHLSKLGEFYGTLRDIKGLFGPNGTQHTAIADDTPLSDPAKEYLDGMLALERSCFSELQCYDSKNYTVHFSSESRRSGDSVYQGCVTEHETSEDLRQWAQNNSDTPVADVNRGIVTVRTVLFGPPPAPGALSMSGNALLCLLQIFEIPTQFFQSMVAGVSCLVYGDHRAMRRCLDKGISYVFRAPLSINEDWTLGARWDPSTGQSNFVLHGLRAESDRATILDRMFETEINISHPLILPVILCEMLTDADMAGIRGSALELWKVEVSTNFAGVRDIRQRAGDKSPEESFSDMTRILNLAISRFAFHEMRLKSNTSLVRQILDCLAAIDEQLEIRPETSDGLDSPPLSTTTHANWRTGMRLANSRLTTTLLILETRQKSLLLEVDRESKIAQSQVQIVYSLIAQRDNKNNLQMAEISTKIADLTRRDSFAMFTLAVMSILFLPGAFIATLFSIDFFDWDAEKPDPMIKSRFWIYWAVTLPLTFLVLIGWLSWLQHHHRSQKSPLAHAGVVPGVSESQSPGGARLTRSPILTILYSLFPRWQSKYKHWEDEETDLARYRRRARTTGAQTTSEPQGETLQRTNVRSQGPRR